jgi:predicted nucleic acid-binding protein
MILVDTNVISEPLRPQPDAKVIDWLRRGPENERFFSTISVAEMLRGCAILPDGKRRRQMADDIRSTIDRLFPGRILTFDEPAAVAYADMHGRLKTAGRPIGILDGQIAAIALAHGATIATRHTRPFIDAGLDVINPWGGA